ncbi:MAG: nuclear transport factor 2 family protein [Pseudomonadota bacterium]
MSAREFIERYKAALRTQDWAEVAPLISDNARVVFSNGAVHVGKDAIKAAYMRNFTTIKNEDYRVDNVLWLAETPSFAAYMFDFHWTGWVEGQAASGSGRGTAVLAREANGWVLVGEQLGPKS